MLLEYTRWVKFEDNLRLYRRIKQLLRRDLALEGKQAIEPW